MKRVWIAFLILAVFLTSMVVPCAAADVNAALLSYIGGDVNADWEVTTTDARLIYMYSAGTAGADDAAGSRGDVDGNHLVNMVDAFSALQLAVSADPQTTLIKPNFPTVETAVSGESIPFTIGNEDRQYADDGRLTSDMWVAQSLKEFQATYTHSYSNQDYSQHYTEDFFEDKAVIIYGSHYIDEYFSGMSIDRIVKSGTELCVVRTIALRDTAPLPYHHFERYFLEINKADLAGIETVSICTEYTYI